MPPTDADFIRRADDHGPDAIEEVLPWTDERFRAACREVDGNAD